MGLVDYKAATFEIGSQNAKQEKQEPAPRMAKAMGRRSLKR